MKPRPLATRSLVLELVRYCPVSGVFTWRRPTSNCVKAGSIAGGLNSKGYRHIELDGAKFKASRLAWLIVTGEDPGDHEIDHMNRDRSDDRFSNLRLATRTDNCRNINTPKHNTSGTRGVSRHSRSGKWEAYIYLDKKRIQLGTFAHGRNLPFRSNEREHVFCKCRSFECALV